MDASSHRLLNEDLSQALADNTKAIAPHASFETYCNSFEAMRRSPKALAGVKYFKKHLAGIENHRNFFYPPAEKPREPAKHLTTLVQHSWAAPGLNALRKEHPELSAPLVLMTALILVNVSRTKHSHGFYCKLEGNRERFPFVPEGLPALDGADVAGPTLTAACQMIPVDRNETALQMLKRMRALQDEQHRHTGAPWKTLIEELNADGSEAGTAMIEACGAMVLSWVPGWLGTYDHLKVTGFSMANSFGMCMFAGCEGVNPPIYSMKAAYDKANYSAEKTQMYLKNVGSVVRWLTQESTRNATVGSLLDA